MCGIAGIIDGSKNFTFREKHFTNARSIKHRGPDHQGYWLSEKKKDIAIGNTRLSIQDLSNKGNQPFFSPTKNYIVVMNGEIYNHLNLRQKVEKNENFTNWIGKSDTETLAVLLDFMELKKPSK